MSAYEASDALQIGPEGGAMEGEERLGGEVKSIRDGQTDAPITYVKSERSTNGHAGSVFAGDGFASGLRP